LSNRFDEFVRRVKEKRGGPAGGLATLDDEQQVVAAYARWAPVYDPIFGLATGIARKSATTTLNRLPAGRILEVGVGTGISLPLYKREHRIVGIDLSPDMLSRAEKRVARRRLRTVEALHEMDASNLTFPDGSFDAAVAMFVMTVVPDPDRVLDEIARIVRPGGHVLLVNHFSVEKGPRAAIEKSLTKYSGALGWRPEFSIDNVLRHPEMKLTSRRELPPADLFTLLLFDRL
jgi:phosphatidylethanolamine/phosphatidyl-N-methylethanolamine N-methyltransferase